MFHLCLLQEQQQFRRLTFFLAYVIRFGTFVLCERTTHKPHAPVNLFTIVTGSSLQTQAVFVLA